MKNQKQRWLLVKVLAFKETNQNTQEVRNERFLISTIQNNVHIFAICYLYKATNRQTDVKHEKEKKN